MRIAHVVPDVGPDDGRGRAVLEVARRQRDQGNEVHLVVARGESEGGMTMHRIAIPRRPWSFSTVLFAIRAAQRVRGLRRRDEVDVVHAHVPVCVRADVVTCHGLPRGAMVRAAGSLGLAQELGFRTKDMERVKALLPLLEWNLRSEATEVVALHDEAAHELTVLADVPEDRITVIPNGVDGDRFERGALLALGEEVRRRLALDGPTLLFVGHDFKRKGLALVLRALARLGEPCPHLLVVGSDPHDTSVLRRFQEMVRTLGVGERVHFLGSVEEVRGVYGAADLFVLPSAYEGMCLAVLEAMSASLPVVGTDASLPESLRCGGTVAVQHDAGEIARAVAHWLSDEPARLAAGRAARERASEFTWESHAESLATLYRRALDFQSRH